MGFPLRALQILGHLAPARGEAILEYDVRASEGLRASITSLGALVSTGLP